MSDSDALGGEERDPLAQYTSSFTSDRILPGFGDGSTQFAYVHPDLASPLLLTIPGADIKQIFAHRQWRAGLRMADRVASGVIDVKDKTVIEMGAGTGLPGILSVIKGSKLTVLTDYDDSKLISTLRLNVQKCLPSPSERSRANVIPHIWGQDTEDLLDPSPAGYDLILCADILWDTFSHPSLLHTLTPLLSRTPLSRIIVISGLHTGRAPLARFIRLAAVRGLVVDKTGNCQSGEAIKEVEVGGEERDWDEERPDEDVRVRNRWTLEFMLMWKEFCH